MRSVWGSVQSLLAAFVLGAAGGTLFFLLHIPLPWTIGSLLAAALASHFGGGRWLMPAPVRDVARPVLGILAGSAFTPAIAKAIPGWWDGVLFVFIFALSTTWLGWLFFHKVCKFDVVTSFFASTPGGLAELTLLGGSLGGDIRRLVVIHAVRVVAVMLAVPIMIQIALGHPLTTTLLPGGAGADITWKDSVLLIGCGVLGYAFGKHGRFPGGVMIASMFFSALVHSTGLTNASPPGWLVAAIQIVVGSIAGSRFLGVTPRELATTGTLALAWAILSIVLLIAAASVASLMIDQPFPILLLAAAPGGIAEMTIISYSLGIGTAFVITCQVCRALFILTLVPFLFRVTVGRRLTKKD